MALASGSASGPESTSGVDGVTEVRDGDKAVEGLRQYGGTMLKSSLSKETEAELQDALHGEGSNA